MFFEENDFRKHTVIYGTTGEGLSSFNNAFEHNFKIKENNIMSEKTLERDIAVKNAYIEKSNLDEDFYIIKDSLYEALEIENITSEQIKNTLLLFPDSIFFEGIKWGFDDSVVRDNIYSYVMNNKEKIKKEIF